MKTVTIQLVLTLTSPNAMPIQIRKRVSIALGRNLDGTPMTSLFDDPGTQHEGVLEVDLSLPPTASFEFPTLPLRGGISRLAPDGKLFCQEISSQPMPMSRAYRQLTLLAEEL